MRQMRFMRVLLSLSLSQTNTHTHAYTLSLSLSNVIKHASKNRNFFDSFRLLERSTHVLNCSIDRNNVKDLCSVPILYGIQHLDAKIKGTSTDYSVKIV